MPANTVNVDRSTKWGNPWRIGLTRCHGSGFEYREEPVRDADMAVRFFRDMVNCAPRNYPSNEDVAAELRGKNLACWCKAGSPCHADVLLEIGNGDGGRAALEQKP